MDFFKSLIKNTEKSIILHKEKKIITEKEYKIYINKLYNLYKDCINNENKTTDFLQSIHNRLCNIIQSCGTYNLSDVVEISLNKKNIFENDELYLLLLDNFHSYSYFIDKINKDPIVHSNGDISLNKKIINEKIQKIKYELDDITNNDNHFYSKCCGAKITIYDNLFKLTIYGIFKENEIELMSNLYIKNIKEEIIKNKPENEIFNSEIFDLYVNSLNLKELLLLNKKYIYHKFNGIMNQIKSLEMKITPIKLATKLSDFAVMKDYNKREYLRMLLLNNNSGLSIFKTITDMIIMRILNENKKYIIKSLGWELIKNIKIDTIPSKINTVENKPKKNPIESSIKDKILNLNICQNAKDDALLKLKQSQSNDGSGGGISSKAQKYIETLLKIPFDIYKSEPVLETVEINNKILHKNIFVQSHSKIYTNYEISQIIKNKEKIVAVNSLYNSMIKGKKNKEIINILEKIGLNNEIEISKTLLTNKKILYKYLLSNYKKIDELYEIKIIPAKKIFYKNIEKIEKNHLDIHSSLQNINKIMDKCVYGHNNAKRQIQRIIGQWINGNNNGYCFGFEGPPGVGKTTLAKYGIANCLKDKKGEPRPFAFITVGGSSNGSTLIGHNYTYVGSNWGQIINVLITKKCMNPIIFIDELDKVSTSERGREIISILTHLTDFTQNNEFHDKYFRDINFDLSKALIIFSYNDSSLIDNILLDRIHRIKFDNINVKDKIIITRKYILPEFNKKINIPSDLIVFSDDIIKYIIEKYTYEAGVRKLKEIIFEIMTEINLELIENNFTETKIIITKENLERKYLKNRFKRVERNINHSSYIGKINGLWANTLGLGGITKIECQLFPTNTFMELKLTGMQGKVMKESMNIAKTLAYNLTNSDILENFVKNSEKTKLQGLHIHCPEGAVKKDGPSAGTAITCCLYSILNNKKIRDDIAITGEINLSGEVTKIGGLESKIIGGIDCGIKEFIFPKENENEYNKFLENHSYDGIKYHMVETLSQVFDILGF